MSDPFEDPWARYYALVNEQDQYCLWPCSVDVPAGWCVAHGPDDRHACVEHIDNQWTDLRPARAHAVPASAASARR